MSNSKQADLILEPFELTDEKSVFQCSIFEVNSRVASTKDHKNKLNVYTFNCADWVNIVPITASGQVVLVEQHRFGTNSFTLEVPGGAVERSEKDSTLAALRELEEETGLTSQRILSLPKFFPNPALQSNKVTYFIAFDVQPLSEPNNHNDPFENIKLHFIDFHEAVKMVRSGQIQHSLSALAILLAEPYFTTKFSKPLP